MRTFRAANGYTLTALDDTQASAMIQGGMVEVFSEEFTCKHCSFTAENKGALMVHYRQQHPKG